MEGQSGIICLRHQRKSVYRGFYHIESCIETEKTLRYSDTEVIKVIQGIKFLRKVKKSGKRIVLCLGKIVLVVIRVLVFNAP